MMNDQTAQLKPPFFVFEDNDLTIFRDMQSLQAKLEAVDIESGVYRIFDSSGSLLSFKVTDKEMKFFLFNILYKTFSFDGIFKVDTCLFRNILIEYCQDVINVNMADRNTDDILDLLIKRNGYAI